MQYIFMILMAAAIIAGDQVTKYLTVQKFQMGETLSVIPGVVGLTYIQNRGAAWGSFEGMLWLFGLIFLVFTAAIVWEFSKKKMPFTNFDRWCITAIWAGGLGNMIDRIRLGYVVDMIRTEFINFPVFNVADCFITCGCIALMVHLVFFNKTFWKEEKK